MFYLLNKKEGVTSFATIKKFAKQNNIKKIGHTGILDKMASGLLLIATNEDTKLINYVDKDFKTYVAHMKIGFKSDTYDTTGNVEKVLFNNNDFSKEKIIKVIKSFEKEYNQVPPIFSAKKINGQRSYKLAREGKNFTLKPSKVKIKKIEKIVKISNFEYKFEVTVSRGTYIRSLIHDIGLKLNTNAIMSSLIRIKINNLTLKNVNQKIDINKILVLKIIKLNAKDVLSLLKGKKTKLFFPNKEYAVAFKNEIIGIVKIENNDVVKRNLFGKKIKRLTNESN